MAGYFTPRTFTFLRALKAHNDREWFLANRQRYLDDVEAPMLAFIGDFGARLRGISPAFIADPRRTGGSMFRIYRDVRFSADKSPYKTHAAAWFPHESRKKNPSAPGFYLHIEPKEQFGGGGIYHPDPQTLARVRLRIVSHGKDWAKVRATGLAIEGDTLQRAPAGFDPAHRFADDLKRKDHYTITEFRMSDVCGSNFLDRYAAACDQAAPLVRFLTTALGGRW
jgi:uncharacterized protein (TIGR02453 family)